MALKRFYAKELVGFVDVELEFEGGLSVFTGASGSGKSVLMEGILSVFGYKDPKALSAEAEVDARLSALEDIGIESEDINTFRYLKKDKARYFVNANSIAKKDLSAMSKLFSFYLSSKDDSDFTDTRLLGTLDSFVQDKNFAAIKNEYKEAFTKLGTLKKELARLREKSIKAAQEREFLEFELKKFSEIDPKEGEEEELLAIKKELSKKEKIGQLLSRLEQLKGQKHTVVELFEFLGRQNEITEEFFAQLDEAMGEVDFKLSRLDGVDIDKIFERLEKLSYLNKRYGGISEAIEYFESKKAELKELDELDSTVAQLELDIKDIEKTTTLLSEKISVFRRGAIGTFSQKLGFFAKKLLIGEPKVSLVAKEASTLGCDGMELKLGNSAVSTLSAGEYRRLRLALMACEGASDDENSKAILFLDEADANLSGEESAGVAYLLKELAHRYQIFAISHQPQLASVATHHFVVSKDENGSYVKKLKEGERAAEIARMVSSGDVTKEAMEYAKQMLASGSKC